MAERSAKAATSPTVHFVAGSATGVLSATLLQPADLLKTRLQQAHHASLRVTLRTLLRGPHAVRQLWRGTLPSVLRTGAGSGLYFTSLDAARRLVARSVPSATVQRGPSASSSALPQLSNTGNLVSGAVARTAAGFVLMPLTVLKVRYESDLYAYPSLRSAAAGVFRTEGMRGFFAGAGVTALRDAPYAGLYVLFYEQAKRRITAQLNAVRIAAAGIDGSGAAFVVGERSSNNAEKKMLRAGVAAPVNFASGVIAATTATALTNPFDAVKTRLQLQPQEYGNMWRAARLMLRREGMRSFFDGLALRMTRKAMSSALVWTLYEELVRIAETRIV